MNSSQLRKIKFIALEKRKRQVLFKHGHLKECKQNIKIVSFFFLFRVEMMITREIDGNPRSHECLYFEHWNVKSFSFKLRLEQLT